MMIEIFSSTISTTDAHYIKIFTEDINFDKYSQSLTVTIGEKVTVFTDVKLESTVDGSFLFTANEKVDQNKVGRLIKFTNNINYSDFLADEDLK